MINKQIVHKPVEAKERRWNIYKYRQGITKRLLDKYKPSTGLKFTEGCKSETQDKVAA